MAFTPYNGTFTLSNGTQLINDGAGIRRADGRAWNPVGGSDPFAPPNNDWASVLQAAMNGDTSGLGDLAPYAQEIISGNKQIAEQEHYAGAPLSEGLKYFAAAMAAGAGAGALGLGAAGAGAGAGAAAETAALTGSGLGSFGGASLPGGMGAAAGALGGGASWGVNPIGGGAAEEAAALGGGLGANAPIAPTTAAGGLGGGLSVAEEMAGLGGYEGATPIAPGTAAAGGSLVNQAAQSALSRILSGNGTAADWAQALGTAGSTALGVYGSQQQADTLKGIAEQARTDRAPFLNKSLEWLNDPAAYAAGPGKSSLDATLRALSVQGNPFGSPTNLAIAGDIANKGWQNAVTGFGNIGLTGADNRNSYLAQAATADRGTTTALASGLGSLTQPDNSLDALLKQLKSYGSNPTGLI